VYLTDGYGAFPDTKPAYPTIWAMTTDEKAPWGDVVRIKVS
jgi:predicted metal-dependent peptidase